MSSEQLTAVLADRILGWRTAPGRFMMAGRGWTPAWRFQPTEKREDAFRLLDAAAPLEYSIAHRHGARFIVRVLIGDAVGAAEDSSEARAITYAIARAIGVEPEEHKSPKTGADAE